VNTSCPCVGRTEDFNFVSGGAGHRFSWPAEFAHDRRPVNDVERVTDFIGATEIVGRLLDSDTTSDQVSSPLTFTVN
jgi:hypothetical protein